MGMIGRSILLAAIAVGFLGGVSSARAEGPWRQANYDVATITGTVKMRLTKYPRHVAAHRKTAGLRHARRISVAHVSTKPQVSRKIVTAAFCASDPLRIEGLAKIAGWSIEALVKPFIRPFKMTEPLAPWQIAMIDELADARAHLIRTASPGGTMTRQGPEIAIGRLHPEFAIRLAKAIREARANGLPSAAVFSAYRPPAFGVGGFGDKNRSLHSYGLAVDMAGIGRPGSREAVKWHQIAGRYKIVGPYGPYNHAEWNHMQLVQMLAVAPRNPLRETITSAGPRILDKMWQVATSFINERVITKITADRPRARYAHRHRGMRYVRHWRHRVRYAKA